MVAGSGIPFLDLAANQVEFAKALATAVAPSFDGMVVPVRCWRLPACRGARPDGAPGWAQSL